jgi:hypothetical protein
MKKLALVLVVAAASVFAVGAEPVGIDVGSEVYISGLAAGDTGLAISPWIGTGKIAIPQIDTYLTLGADVTFVQDYNFDDVYVQGDFGKTFKISDTLAVTPTLSLFYTAAFFDGETTNIYTIRPNVAVATGKFKTTVYLPIDITSEDTTSKIRIREATSFGDLGVYGQLDYAISPDAKLANIKIDATYPVSGITLEAATIFSGFDTDLALTLLLAASYSF